MEPARLDSLIDDLADAKVPFSGLSGGLWRASYTRGRTPRWQANQKLLPFVKNVAGQEYDASVMRVVNYGEVAGASFHFTAEGTFR